MKVGIIGESNRTAVWEQHLRQLTTVREVVQASEVKDLDSIRICLLIDDSPDRLIRLEEAIRQGIHTFLVSELPTDTEALRRIHAVKEESGVQVQLAHWPTLSPSTQWMRGHLPKPKFLQVIRELPVHSFSDHAARFEKQWIDETAWIVKWIGSELHSLNADVPLPGLHESGIRIHLVFQNGAVGSLFYFAMGQRESHRRIAAGNGLLLDSDLLSHRTRMTDVGDEKRIQGQSRTFDPSTSASLAAQLFLKSIQLRTFPAYTPHDALMTAQIVSKIRDRISLP